MKKQTKPKLTAAEQSALFKETARALGADERPEAFDKILKDVAPRRGATKPHPAAKKSRP
jgi:hypothetical protein